MSVRTVLMGNAMWMIDLPGGVSQSMLIGLGVWVAFAFLWTFSPKFGVQRDVSMAYFGASSVGGLIGARVVWWLSQLIEHGGEFGAGRAWLDLINPFVSGYSSLGFLMGACLVVLTMTRQSWMGETTRGRVLDVVVLAGFLGLVFARLGCVFHGCDFGRVSHGANVLKIRYARGSLAWQHHHMGGLIEREQMWSLPTDGFALYSAAATLLVVLGVSVWAQRYGVHGRPAGIVAWLAIVLFCILQFVVEFLREPTLEGSLWMQLNLNQIALLGAFLIACACRIIYLSRETERHRKV